MANKVVTDMSTLVNLAVTPTEINFDLLRISLQLIVSQITHIDGVRVQFSNFPVSVPEHHSEITVLESNAHDLFKLYDVSEVPANCPFDPQLAKLTPKSKRRKSRGEINTLVVVENKDSSMENEESVPFLKENKMPPENLFFGANRNKVIQHQIEELQRDIKELRAQNTGARSFGPQNQEQFPMDLKTGISIPVKKYLNEQFRKRDQHTGDMHKGICDMKKDIYGTKQEIPGLMNCCHKSTEQITEIFHQLNNIKEKLKTLQCDLKDIASDAKKQRYALEVQEEKIEHVKCLKANYVEVEQKFAEKADKIDLRNKVDMDTFEYAKKELSHSAVSALERIIESDTNWQKAIDVIFNKLDDMKVNKSEFASVQNDVLSNLVVLKEQLFEFGMFRMSCESAATTKKYLKDVNCLICNAQTYMKREMKEPLCPKLNELKLKKINKEFSKLRVPCNKNVIKGPNIELRFCGGSHTKTAATERLFREDHSPIRPIDKSEVSFQAGTDGVFYQVENSINNMSCDCLEQ